MVFDKIRQTDRSEDSMENNFEGKDQQSRLVFSNQKKPKFDPQTGEPIHSGSGLKRSQNLAGNAPSEMPAKGDQWNRRPFEQKQTYDMEETVKTQNGSDWDGRETVAIPYMEEDDYASHPSYDPETGAPLSSVKGYGRSQYSHGKSQYSHGPYETETEAPQENLFSDTPQQNLYDDFRHEESKKGNRLFMILMIVLSTILLAGIGVVLFFVLKGCDGEETRRKSKPTPSATDAPTQEEDSFIDTWIVSRVKKDGKIYAAKDVGFEGSFTFRKDGTVRILTGAGEKLGTYISRDKKITFSTEEITAEGMYDPATDELFLNFPDQGYSIWLTRGKSEEQPQSTDPGNTEKPSEGPEAETVHPFPTEGVSDEEIDKSIYDVIANNCSSFSIIEISHKVDAKEQKDKVTLTLDEVRSDDTYRSAVELYYTFDPYTGTWKLTDCKQTVPESFSHLFPAPETPLPNVFLFGGAEIKKGDTAIDGEALGINGTKDSIRRITADEVQMLTKMCPYLRTLKLQYCYMDTYEPLSKLIDLETIELRFCYYGDKGVPITNIDWVAPLKKLRKLAVNHNRITDVKAIEGLTELRELNLGENLVNDDAMPIIGTLTKLTTLNLYNNPLSDFDQLEYLDNVTYLNFHNTNVKSIDFLKKMEGLKRIFIGLNFKGETLPEFNWFSVIANTNIREVVVKSKENYIKDELDKLKKEGYIDKYTINGA